MLKAWQNSPNGQNGPKFSVFYAKKDTGLKKVHHRRRLAGKENSWRFQILMPISGIRWGGAVTNGSLFTFRLYVLKSSVIMCSVLWKCYRGRQCYRVELHLLQIRANFDFQQQQQGWGWKRVIQHKLISRYVICPFSVVDERMNVKVLCNVFKHCCQETAYTNIK